MVVAFTAGLPSMSPPTQLAKRRNAGHSNGSAESVPYTAWNARSNDSYSDGTMRWITLARWNNTWSVSLSSVGRAERCLLRAPADVDLFGDPIERALFLDGRESVPLQPIDQRSSDALLFAQEDVAHGLGRVGGEHGFESQGFERLSRLSRGHPTVGPGTQHGIRTARLRSRTLVLSSPTKPVNLLSHVDDGEVRRKKPEPASRGSPSATRAALHGAARALPPAVPPPAS